MVDFARRSSFAGHAELAEICSEKASEEFRMPRVGRDVGGIGAGRAPERPCAAGNGVPGMFFFGETCASYIIIFSN